MNLVKFLFQNARNESNALIDGDRTVSYGELIDQVEQIKNQLLALKITNKRRVALIVDQPYLWIHYYLGILKANAVAVPISESIIPMVLKESLDHVDCDLVVISKTCYVKFKPYLFDENLIIIDGEEVEVVMKKPLKENKEKIDIDLATLMFTSGSTGKPKAVMVTHKNIITNTTSIISYLNLTREDKIFCSLPLYYCFGASLLHTHLRAGACIVFRKSTRVKDCIHKLLDAGVNSIAGVPSFYQILLRSNEILKSDFKSIKKIQQAGGRLAPVFVKELSKVFDKADIFLMYGQTEATARLSFLPPKFIEEKAGSIGKGIPNCELTILKNNYTTKTETKEVGEILAKGDNITTGYWKEKTMTNKLFTKDGWLKTGDLGYFDEDGFIFIVGRDKSFIKSAGHRINPFLVEDYLLQHSDLIEAAILPTPDIIRGEAMIAFLVKMENSDINKRIAIKYCRNELPGYMVPKYFLFLKELPKTNTGKVDKVELSKLVDSLNIGDASKNIISINPNVILKLPFRNDSLVNYVFKRS